jgi:phage terminase large subunit-like protein
MLAADSEMGAEVYAGATCERQAWEVFRPAKQMVERTPELQAAFGIKPVSKGLTILENGSRFEPVVAAPGDGASPSCGIVDEYHEHRTDQLVDTFITGMGARRQPLLWIISTAGSNLEGPCLAMQRDVERVLAGSITRDDLFGIIFTIDKDDDWASPEALIKANPNYGVSVSEAFLKAQQNAAIQSARKQTVFRTKHLNEWVGASTAFINAARWRELADAALRRDQFRERDDLAYAAVDLSSKLDITSRVLVFRRMIEGAAHYFVFGRHFVPAERIREPELEHYRTWTIEGHLTTTPGHVIDYPSITDDTIAEIKECRIKEIGFDPWNSEHFAQSVAAATPAIAVEIPQQVRHLSEPMKQLEALVTAGRIHHDGNPVLAWMMGNLVGHIDAKDNVFPRKESAASKIDGAVALIMALSRALNPSTKTSIYSTRGVLTL